MENLNLEDGLTRVSYRYIVKNGKRINPKHSQFFTFTVRPKLG